LIKNFSQKLLIKWQLEFNLILGIYLNHQGNLGQGSRICLKRFKQLLKYKIFIEVYI